MKLNHWKIIAGLLAVILILACILWYRGLRQPTPNPDAPSFADTIRENQRRADQHADTTAKRNKDYEAKDQNYNNWDPASPARDSLGARIWRDAQAKDSLRKRAP